VKIYIVSYLHYSKLHWHFDKITFGFFSVTAPHLFFVDVPLYLCFILAVKAEYIINRFIKTALKATVTVALCKGSYLLYQHKTQCTWEKFLETSYEVSNRKINTAGKEKCYTIKPHSQNMPDSNFLFKWNIRKLTLIRSLNFFQFTLM